MVPPNLGNPLFLLRRHSHHQRAADPKAWFRAPSQQLEPLLAIVAA